VSLILVTVALATIVGLVTGGSLRAFPSIALRWWGLAIVGVVLQFVPVPVVLAYAVLLLSFATLLVFTFINLRAAGFVLIFVGLMLNAVVIVANHGMPVTMRALAASGEVTTLHELRTNGGAKHHLAEGSSVLLPLADSIGIGTPIDEAVSVGDLCVQLGVGWFIVAALRPRPSSH
jgi:Family of unknown function (DUF5317)